MLPFFDKRLRPFVTRIGGASNPALTDSARKWPERCTSASAVRLCGDSAIVGKEAIDRLTSPAIRYEWSQPATSGAWYEMMMSAPARFIPVRASRTAALSSSQPFWAAAFIMEYSPLTL